MSDTLYIIDGHSQIYRAYYAPFRDLTSPTGEPTRATYIFTQMLLNFIRDRQPTHLAMAVDGPREKLRRTDEYAEYKATRKPMPDDLRQQIGRIIEIIQAVGVPIVTVEGYEADDIIATAATKFASDDMNVCIISRDKDLDQLISPHVVLYDPMKNVTIDAAAIEKDKGYPPSLAVEVQTLTGDATDNIPGVPGVGPKTAAKLILQYGSVENVIAHADELTPKLRQSILDNAATIPLTRKLVTLERDAPLGIGLDEMKYSGPDRARLVEIFRELGFNKLLDQLGWVEAKAAVTPGGLFGLAVSPASQAASPTVSPAANQSPAVAAAPLHEKITVAADFDYRCVDTPVALDELAKNLRGVKRLSVDTETTGISPMFAQMVGMSLAWTPGVGYYIPVKGPLGATVLDIELVREKIGPVLADASVMKVGQNLKYDLLILRNAGFTVTGEMFDTMIAAHVLDSMRPTLKLDALSMEYLGHRCIPIEDVIGRGRNQTTMDAVPVETVAIYAAEDADVALRLADVLVGLLENEGLADLFWKLEMPLMPVLTDMEYAGIKVDPLVLRRMETEFSKKADEIKSRIIQNVGHEFNVDSPKQLAAVMFDELSLPVIKKTKTGASTDSEVLEELTATTDHPLPAMVLEYRKLTKLISTYLISLAQCIHPRTGRVHTSFHQAGTVTGRLSSSDPNLQNIPVRTEEGRRIRSAFVADEGSVLLAADYSQIELRVLAHFCQDPTLISAFANDLDIHRIVAAEVFGVPPDQVTSEQRGRAKTVNFGIIYGQSAFGLAKTLGIPRRQAGEFIDQYRKRFPMIDQFLGRCVEKAKADGFVETIMGRRRRIVGLDSRNMGERQAAERLAINSTVQGSAADMIKRAMVNIDARIRRENSPAKLLLQIHDELVFQIPADAAEAARKMVVEEMTDAVKLSVPLKVDSGLGQSWMEAK